MNAVINGNDKLIKCLITKGVDVNATDSSGQLKTSLHLAARNNNNAEIVKILIEKGVNINAPSDAKLTPSCNLK